MTSSIYDIPDVLHRNETVSSLVLGLSGDLYETPIVTIDAPTTPGGVTATGTAIATGEVISITLIDGGKGYTTTPTVDFEVEPPGTGASASVVFGVVNDIAITDSGAGYTNVPKVTIAAPTSPGGVTATAVAITQNNEVIKINLTENGSGYTKEPGVTIAQPTVGSNTARADAKGTFGKVDSITLISGGSDYASNTLKVIITGGGASTAAEASGKVSGPITSVSLTDGGSGYTSVPLVTISDATGPGTGATATAIIEVINADENILDNDIVITPAMVSPGGGGILRVYFSFEFDSDANATISVFNEGVFKGNLNADNNSEVLDEGNYRFDIDVESGDEINFQSSVNIDSVNFFRTHLIQFGA